LVFVATPLSTQH